PAQLQEALDLLLQRAPPERRAVADDAPHLRPPRVQMEVQRLRPVRAELPVIELAEHLARDVLDHQPHDLPFDPARHRLDQAADVRVDFGRRQKPGPAGAVTTMNPLTRSLTRRSPTRVGGRGGGASPTLTPTRATGPGGRAWNDISPRREPRQVHHRPRRNRVERDAPRLGVEGQEPL